MASSGAPSEGGVDGPLPQQQPLVVAEDLDSVVGVQQQTDNDKPRTPQRSTQPTTARSARRNTPGAGRFNPPKSPYVKVAYERGRRLSQSRRRSLSRNRRDSDRDILLKLSRKLAPGTSFPEATPRPTPKTPRIVRAASEPPPSESIVLYNDHDDHDDEEDMAPPPFSFGLDGYNEDDSEDMMRPPRLMSEEPISTISRRQSRRISIEHGRRARGRVSDFSLFGGLEDMSFYQQARDRAARNSIGHDLQSNPMNVSFNGSPGIPIIDQDQREMSIVNDEEQPMFEDDTFNAILPGSDDDFQMEALPEQDEEAGAEYEQTGGIEVFEDAEDYGGFGGFEEEYETANNGDFYDDDDAQEASSSSKSNPRERKKKALNISASGNEYPVFPKRVVKKLAQKQGMKISNETLNALMSATDEFFAQASISMGRYARHAGRRTVTDEDANLLLQRQRQTNEHTTAFSLAQKHLPRELLSEIRMTGANSKRGRK